jgi:hypothetical protein
MNRPDKLDCCIRSDWKGLPRTNTLTSGAHLQVTKKVNCCVNTAPGLKILYHLITQNRGNRFYRKTILDCSTSFFSIFIWQMFFYEKFKHASISWQVSKQELVNFSLFKAHFPGFFVVHSNMIWGDATRYLFWIPEPNVLKNTFSHELQMFVISDSVCPWRAIPAEYNVCE